MTSLSRRRRFATTAQSFGAVAAMIGLSLTAAPLVASADETTTKRIMVEVTVGDIDNKATLAGASVTVRAQPSGIEVGTRQTGLDGRVAFDIDPDASSQYSAHALWPSGDAMPLNGSKEFVSDNVDVVGVWVGGSYRFVAGRISANLDNAPVADLTGGAVTISHSGVTVQTLPLAADGTFASQALPTDEDEAYLLTFTAPPAYAVASGQGTASFALPSDDAGSTTLALSSVFAVTRTATPEPTPAPEPEPAPETPPAPPIELADGAHLGSALDDISEPALDSLLAAVEKAGPGNVVPITNASGQVLGLASAPRAPARQALAGMVGSMGTSLPGVSVNSIPVVVTDLESMLMTVQSERATLLESQLRSQVDSVQARNDAIARMSAAIDAANSYRAAPTVERRDAARAAARTAGVASDPFFNDAAPSSGTTDTLIQKLKGMIDAAALSQQMDMLRLQSMSNKRNEAFDVMSNFVKKMQESRSSIVGSMRSQPVAIGTVQWNSGVVTQGFDLSAVPNGSHHLILRFADAGVTVIGDVAVQREMLPATGVQSGPSLTIGLAMFVFGLVTIAGARVLRRRAESAR